MVISSNSDWDNKSRVISNRINERKGEFTNEIKNKSLNGIQKFEYQANLTGQNYSLAISIIIEWAFPTPEVDINSLFDSKVNWTLEHDGQSFQNANEIFNYGEKEENKGFKDTFLTILPTIANQISTAEFSLTGPTQNQ